MLDSQINSDWRVDRFQPVFDSETIYFAIIETELWPEWKYYCYHLAEQPEFDSLFIGTRFSQIENGPVVIVLTQQEALFDQCLDVIKEKHCGCILSCSSEVELSDITSALKSRLITKTEQGEAILRFYDPRTLLPLMAVMKKDERSAFWSPVERVIWHSQQWLTVSVEPFEESLTTYHWRMTHSHLETMQIILEQYLRSNDS